MTLRNFLTRRFFLFLAVITLFLASLFTIVEFFEKFLRVSHASASSIVYFSCLNFLPTLFDLLPVSGWLATILLLRELIARQEWEFLQVLTFIPRAIFSWLFACGLGLMIVVFVCRETVGARLIVRAEQFRQEKFKQHVHNVLFNQWFELDEKMLCYAGVIDRGTQQGKDLLFMHMDNNFVVTSMLVAPEFILHEDIHTVTVPVGILYDIEYHSDRAVQNYSFTSPSLFFQMRMHHEVPTVLRGLATMATQFHVLPPSVLRDVVRRCLVHMCYYLSLVLYPLFTLFLFLLFSPSPFRWAFALVPYPYFVILGFVVDALVASGWPVWLIMAPHFIVILLLIMACFRHRPGSLVSD